MATPGATGHLHSPAPYDAAPPESAVVSRKPPDTRPCDVVASRRKDASPADRGVYLSAACAGVRLVQCGAQQVESLRQRALCSDPNGPWSSFPQPLKRLHEKVGVVGSDQAVVNQVFWTRRGT